MFQLIANVVNRAWPWLIAMWLIGLAVIWRQAPAWQSVAQEGEFTFLPPDSPTRHGEKLLRKAFPDERDKSSIVLVLNRNDGQPLTDSEKAFVTDTLKPRLQGLFNASELQQKDSDAADSESLIVAVETFDEEVTGPLLISGDERATLVQVELSTGFLDSRNRRIVGEVEDRLSTLTASGKFPESLNVALTGSAVVGRDELEAKRRSARNIQSWTIWLVLGLLLIVYRAPVLALIPLATLFIVVQITMKLTALLTEAGYVGAFNGQQIYTTVVVYGAGVDYSLFLLSRYQEELQRGLGIGDAVGTSIRRVGTAIAASAATEICGIGMLMLMSFRKFQQAGFSIALGFVLMLLAGLLLTPPLLMLTGRFAFWPLRLSRSISDGGPEKSRSDAGVNIIWRTIGTLLRRWPGITWLVTVLVMLPFAVLGIQKQDQLSYGIVSELPQDATSQLGTRRLTEHFPAGKAGAVTLLLHDDEVDLATPEGESALRELTENLWSRRQQLNIADIRTFGKARGFHVEGGTESQEPAGIGILLRRAGKFELAQKHYVSSTGNFDGHVARLRIILSTDPFARETINQLDALDKAVKASLPQELSGSTTYLLGSTANLRDLKTVADRDRTWIYVLVTAVVLLILVLMLRRLVIPLYLIVTVLFSFCVTMGITFLVFQWWQGERFAGLDWTVPIFLFTLLIAVGEDYNIFLVTRVDEEQQQHGTVNGITEALGRTGGIISGCGVIMAGTFTSLLWGGQLAGMQQLGFALALGVLLDTFVVRTMLVPAYLVLINDGRFGSFSKWLGGNFRKQ